MNATLRLMSSNLLAGQADPSAYAELLSDLAPDIVVTQELGHAQAEILRAHFQYHHLVPTDEFHGRGIATSLDAEFEDIPIPERAGTSALFEIAGKTWVLAGIHLLNPINFPPWHSIAGRSRQLDAIEQWSENRTEQHVVLAGDFNASPRWPAYNRLLNSWNDLVVDFTPPDNRPGKTWAWRPGWPRMLRIDHVFGRGVTATRVEVIPITGSDHHALVADLIAQ